MNYQHSNEVIIGYNESELAKSEKNDCTVRALATVAGVDYETAHAFCEKNWGRLNRKGTQGRVREDYILANNGKIKIGDKEFQVRILPAEERTNVYKLHGELIRRNQTIHSFVAGHKTGRYLMTVSKHNFTIVDGTVIDNVGEEFRPTRKVLGVMEFVEVKAGTGGSEVEFYHEENQVGSPEIKPEVKIEIKKVAKKKTTQKKK